MTTRQELLAQTVQCLKHFAGKAQQRGTVVEGVLLQRMIVGKYDFWMVTDNGGEFNVERVNSPETMRSVSYETWGGRYVDPATMAYRIACVLDDSTIDYTVCMAEDAALLLQTA